MDEYLKLPIEKRHPKRPLYQYQQMFKDELEYEKKPGVDKQRTRTIEIEHYKADGSAIHMEIHISFVRNETGIPIESEPGKGSCFNFSLPV